MTVTLSNLKAIWTNSSYTYNALCVNVTTGLHEADSKFFRLKANGVDVFSIDTTGSTTIKGNISATNITASNNIRAVGNIIAGNISSSGVITSTGNITAGNISSTGVVTSTGNIVAGNISSTGAITSTGPINASSYLINGASFGPRIFDDAVNATRYIPFIDSTTLNSGYMTKANTDTALAYNPGTGALTTTSISDSKGDLRTIVQNPQSVAYQLAATDAGKFINITNGGPITVASGTFSAGQAVTIYNNSSTLTLAINGSGVTLHLAGTTTTGNRTLTFYGVATILCISSTEFVVAGSGLS